MAQPATTPVCSHPFAPGDSALGYLLEKRRRSDPWQNYMAPLLYGGTFLFVLTLCSIWGRYDLVVPLLGISLAFLLPMARALTDTGLLHSLLVGSSLDEVRQTRLTSAEMSDGLTLSSVRWQFVTALIPLALASVFLYRVAGLAWTVLALGGWLLFALFATALASYSMQFYLARNYCSHRRWALPGETDGWIFLGIGTCGAVFALAAQALQFDHSIVMVPIGLTAVGLFLFEQRRLAIDTISQVDQSGPISASSRTYLQRRWQIKPWSDNPIVVRECARTASSYRWGFVSYVWQRGMLLWMGAAGLLVCWLCCAPGRFGSEATVALPIFGLVALLVQGCRVGLRIYGALSDERDRGTFETLVISPLGGQDFVDGWAEVGYLPRIREIFLTTGVAVALVLFSLKPSEIIGWDRVIWLAFLFWTALIYAASAFVIIKGIAHVSLALGLRSASRCNRQLDFALIFGMGLWYLASLAFVMSGPAGVESWLGLYLGQMAFSIITGLYGRSLSLQVLGS